MSRLLTSAALLAVLAGAPYPAGVYVVQGPAPAIRNARFVGAGAALQDSTRWLLFYHWTDSPGEPYPWWPQMAQSLDEGQTWQDYGPVRIETPKADHVWIHSALVWEGVPWIFYHWHELEDNTWHIGAASSQDGKPWQSASVVLPPAQGILTNPAAVVADGHVYLFASECIEGAFQIRLYRADAPPGPYEAVSLAVPFGAASWCERGAWDACPVRLPSGRWLLWFSGSAGPPPDRSNTTLGYALAEAIEGPYIVQPEPSFRHSTGVGGRTAAFYRSDGTVTLYSDAFYGGGLKRSMSLLQFTIREAKGTSGESPTNPAGPGPVGHAHTSGSS